ncbi:MAG: hypothetical protein FJX20_14060 [Alphaproteobacteria bacterium]|nr:hypothetical protein [Alphaproteobacteria bacterium]
MEFISFAIPDRGLPASVRQIRAMARRLAGMLGDGKSVAVHCRAGIGRSAVVAACAMICAGMTPQVALERIAKARGTAVSDTDAQRDWVIAFRNTDE